MFSWCGLGQVRSPKEQNMPQTWIQNFPLNQNTRLRNTIVQYFSCAVERYHSSVNAVREPDLNAAAMLIGAQWQRFLWKHLLWDAEHWSLESSVLQFCWLSCAGPQLAFKRQQGERASRKDSQGWMKGTWCGADMEGAGVKFALAGGGSWASRRCWLLFGRAYP